MTPARTRTLVVAVLLALVAPSAVARAEPVQQFSFQLTDVKRDGRFTLVFSSRTFDTTGAQPPELKENYLRLPAGATLRRELRTKRYACDGRALLDALEEYAELRGRFADRVANLAPLKRALRRSRARRERRWLANAETCERARVGVGTATIDARPFIDELIPVRLFLYLAKRTQPRAVAALSILGIPDERAAVVRDNAVVRDTHAALSADFFDAPTPDGRYGYKLSLPTGRINGLPISVAELSVRTTGAAIPKGACRVRRARGGCAKRQRRTVFWFSRPTCPASGRIAFEAFYGYDPPQPSITKTVELDCPRFSR